jgi:putative transcriptional regulator
MEKQLQNKLKVFRAMKDWTQEELARRINVTRKTINTIEKGHYVPSTRLALRMALVFDSSVEEIFQLNEAEAAELRETNS